MTPGSTVLVERDAAGDEEDRPLKLTIRAPKKAIKAKREPEKVGAGAKKAASREGSDGGSHDGERPGDSNAE